MAVPALTGNLAECCTMLLRRQVRVLVFGTFLTLMCKPMFVMLSSVYSVVGATACLYWFFFAKLMDRWGGGVGCGVGGGPLLVGRRGRLIQPLLHRVLQTAACGMSKTWEAVGDLSSAPAPTAHGRLQHEQGHQGGAHQGGHERAGQGQRDFQL